MSALARAAGVGRRRSDSRVNASMAASASTTRPITWAVTTGMPSGSSETFASGAARSCPDRPATPGSGLGEEDGLIGGNRFEALPAPIYEVLAPLRLGSGPTGMLPTVPTAPGEAGEAGVPAAALVAADDDDDELADAGFDAAGEEAGADADWVAGATTCAVSVAVGGWGSVIPVGLSTAFSATDCTELAVEATGTCAGSLVGVAPGAVTVHEEVWLPAPQSVLLKAAAWPAGWAERVIVTSSLLDGVQFTLQTSTPNVPDWPRVMLPAGWVTLMHRVGSPDALAASGLTTAVRVASVVPPAELAAGELEPELEVGCSVFEDCVELAEREVDADEEPVPDAGAEEAGACEVEAADDGGEAGGCDDPVGLAGALLDGPGVESEVLEETWLSGWQFEAVAGAAAAAGASVAAKAVPWAPKVSSTPPPTRPAATARTCTKHMKLVLFCTTSSGQVLLLGFGTTRSRWVRYDLTHIPYNASYA